MSTLFEQCPPIAKAIELGRAIRDDDYAGAPCQVSIEEIGDDLRAKVRRLSDDDVTYSALVAKDWTP